MSLENNLTAGNNNMKEHDKVEGTTLVPYPMAFAHRNYGLAANRIYMVIAERMQRVFHDQLNNTRPMGRGMFRDSELNGSYVAIRIPLSSCSTSPHNFAQVRRIMRRMMETPIAIPYRNGAMREEAVVARPFYFHLDGNRANASVVIMQMRVAVAELLFSMQWGYATVSAELYKRLKSPTTQTLYLIGCQWRESHAVTLPVARLRHLFGCEGKYKKFGAFIRIKLRPACRELQRLYDCGLNPCCVSYRANYGSSRVNPDSVTLDIATTVDVSPTEMEALRRGVASFLTRHLSIPGGKAEQLAARVTPRNYQRTMAKINDILHLLRVRNNIHYKGRYAIVSLSDFFDTKDC